MPGRKPSQRERALQWLRESGAPEVDETTAASASAALPGVSASALREAFLASGLKLSAAVEGVRQETPAQLERTLDALAAEYAAGSAERRRRLRGMVITARQHAEWAARNRKVDSARRAEKAEMVLWLRTWLENPPLFPAWVRLRRATIESRQE